MSVNWIVWAKTNRHVGLQTESGDDFLVIIEVI